MNEAEVKTVAAALYANHCAIHGGDGDYGKLNVYQCLPWRSAACAAIIALDRYRRKSDNVPQSHQTAHPYYH